MKQKDNNRIKNILLSSAHGIVICLVLMGSFSWAWFTETVSGPSIKVQSAIYGIAAEVSGNGTKINTEVSGNGAIDGIIEVENGKTYDVTIKAIGNASEGFCIVSAGDVIFRTEPIGLKPEVRSEISFRIVFDGNGMRKVQFIPIWGQYQYQNEISAGEEVHNGVSVGDVSGNR